MHKFVGVLDNPPWEGKNRAKEKCSNQTPRAIHKTIKGVAYLLSEPSQFSRSRIKVNNWLVLDLPCPVRISEGV